MIRVESAPVLDLEALSFGPIRLGDPVAGAVAIGKPKRALGDAKKGNQTLEYDAFQLEFSEGRLVCVKFDMDDRTVVNMAGDIHLKRATSPLDVQVWFGDPTSDSKGGGSLRWIDFERDGGTLALEFDAKGLNCVQLYAEGYA